MSLFDTTQRLHLALDYHLQRHNLLTANLTHIDTPGFRPLDLSRDGGFEAQLGAAMAVTDPGHLTGASSGAGGAGERFSVIADTGATPGLDGNAVSVDREAVKIAANQLRYDTLATLTSQKLNGLAWAVNDGRAG